jgi:hypothetical protein
MGGLRGMLSLVTSLMTKAFGERMLVSIRNMTDGFKASGSAAQAAAIKMKQEWSTSLKQMATESLVPTAQSAMVDEAHRRALSEQAIYDIKRRLTNEEQ